MAKNLKDMAANKEMPEVKKNDLYKIDPTVIKEEQGFNLRDYAHPEVKQHIENLTETILSGGYIPPIVVRTDGTGNILLVDGHCRTRAALQAIERGATGLMLSAVNFKGSDADRVELMLRSGDGLKFTPLEVAKGYLRLQRMGLSTADIAKRVGKTANHVNQYLNLATANVDVQQMVERGEVAANVAIETVQKHGENAGKVLEQAKEKAAKQGKTKVTAAVVKEWLPPRKELVSLVSVAKQLEKSIVFSTNGKEATVTVSAEVGSKLLEIIAAIEEAEAKKQKADLKRNKETDL